MLRLSTCAVFLPIELRDLDGLSSPWRLSSLSPWILFYGLASKLRGRRFIYHCTVLSITNCASANILLFPISSLSEPQRKALGSILTTDTSYLDHLLIPPCLSSPPPPPAPLLAPVWSPSDQLTPLHRLSTAPPLDQP